MSTLQDDIERFFAKAGYAETTEASYRRSLKMLVEETGDLAELTSARLKEWLGSRGWGNSTQWGALSGIRMFLRFRYGDCHPALECHIKRLKPMPQRSLSQKQTEQLLASFNTGSSKGRRDLAICALFLDTGLRVTELCNLELRWLNMEERMLVARVKGGEPKFGLFSEVTRSFLACWLGERDQYARPEVSTVFVSLGGLTPGNPLTRSGLRVEIHRWAVNAGILDGIRLDNLSPHDLRRTFAMISTELGAPTRTLQEAGRWSDIQMVEWYTRQLRLRAIEPYLPVPGVLKITQISRPAPIFRR